MEETTLRDYLRVLFRQRSVVLVCVFTVCVTVYFGLKMKTPQYESQVKMLISAEKQVESPYYREMIGGQNVVATLTQAEIVKSAPVLERVVDSLKLMNRPPDYEKRYAHPLRAKIIDMSMQRLKSIFNQLPPEQQQALLFKLAVDNLRERVKVEPVRDTNLFTISVKDFDPGVAATIANSVSRSYVIFDLEQQLAELELKYGDKNPIVQQLRDNIMRMTLQSLSGQQMSNVEAIGPASVKIIEQAQMPLQPVGPPKVLIFLLAVVMSVFLGVMLAYMFEYLDPTFKSMQEISGTLNLPVIGTIPLKSMLEKSSLKGKTRSSRYAVFYRNLADQFYLSLKAKKATTALFVSIKSGEGMSTMVANLGYYLSHHLHHSVLLIDANLRKPHLHKDFGLPLENGLSGLLEGRLTFDQAVKKTGEGPDIITADKTTQNPVALLDSSKMGTCLEIARTKYQVVLVDSTELSSSRDALMLSSSTDGILLVISDGRIRRQVAKAAIKPLVDKNAHFLGVVLNKRVFPIPKFIYDRV